MDPIFEDELSVYDNRNSSFSAEKTHQQTADNDESTLYSGWNRLLLYFDNNV